jgi:hypothetical protein
MQAYPIEEVDLVASGLVEEADPETAAERRVTRRQNLADARAQTTDRARLKISDADVDHVSPAETVAGDEEGPLVVAQLRHKKTGDQVKVTGVVTNRGERTATRIRVDVVAFDAEEKALANGSVTLPRALAPGGSAPFSLTLVGLHQEATIRGRASGTVGEVPAGSSPRSTGRTAG